jgi:hypothetical protein
LPTRRMDGSSGRGLWDLVRAKSFE